MNFDLRLLKNDQKLIQNRQKTDQEIYDQLVRYWSNYK